jgi:signal transduction histidine kinase
LIANKRRIFNRKSDIGGGFGLGLYIVKTICDDYRIKIEVTGDKGKGAEFRLNF